MPRVAVCGRVVNFAGLLYIEEEARKVVRLQVWGAVGLTNFDAVRLAAGPPFFASLVYIIK